MAERMPLINPQYFGPNVTPLSGGKIYTYIAGTTTPKATYTDRTEATPLPNPIILDADGKAEVWLESGLYKFKVCDADDVELYTADYVRSYATPEATPGESADNAAASAASAAESQAAATLANTAAVAAQAAAAASEAAATDALDDIAQAQTDIGADRAAAEAAALAAAASELAADTSADAAAASAAAALASEIAAAASAAAAALTANFGVVTQVGSRAAPQAITAAGGISFSGIGFMNVAFVKGTGAGETDVSANPRIAAGSFVGQKLKIVQRSSTDFLKLADGQGLDLSGAWVGDELGRELSLWFDGTNWKEEGRI